MSVLPSWARRYVRWHMADCQRRDSERARREAVAFIAQAREILDDGDDDQDGGGFDGWLTPPRWRPER